MHVEIWTSLNVFFTERSHFQLREPGIHNRVSSPQRNICSHRKFVIPFSTKNIFPLQRRILYIPASAMPGRYHVGCIAHDHQKTRHGFIINSSYHPMKLSGNYISIYRGVIHNWQRVPNTRHCRHFVMNTRNSGDGNGSCSRGKFSLGEIWGLGPIPSAAKSAGLIRKLAITCFELGHEVGRSYCNALSRV